jgi:hypothetical protein
VIQRLKSRGLIPATIVTFALVAAVLAPPVGAALHRFLSTAYSCSTVTVTAAPVSPSTAGTNPIVISGSATCTSPNPVFEFWYLGQGSSTWQLARGYTSSASYNWNSTGALAGNHQWSVWVHDANDSGNSCTNLGCFDNFGNLTYAITTPSCPGPVTATSTPSGSQPGGTQIVITGSTSGCSNSPSFQIWYLGQGSSTWQMVKAYSATATYNWNSTGALAGTHIFSVWAKDSAGPGLHSGLGSTYDVFGNVSITITQPKCTAVTATATPPTAVHGTGAHITIAGTSPTCSNPNPQYEIWYLGQGSSTWQLVKGYSTTATYDWNTTGALAGTHIFSVWIKDAASPGINSALGSTEDTYNNVTVTLS